MLYHRSKIVQMLMGKTGYYKKDIDALLKAYDEVVLELASTVDDDEEVIIQLAEGVRLYEYVVPERERRDPRTNEPIVCEPTIRFNSKASEKFRANVIGAYRKRRSESGE